MTKPEALLLLRKALNNPDAVFRYDQWEAIDKLVNQKKKLLLVERTGWGKSAVYFISTRILRDQGKGPTIIISPLLALMRNQIEAAERLGIRAETINSTNIKDWDRIRETVLSNKVDALLISPERLANDKFMDNVLRPISNNIGLFVVDEAHCISDWGHDFRTDYRRITRILQFMPRGMPVLGTTATANDRVIEDIKSQLGNIELIRGSLSRESLILQNIDLKDQSARLSWLKENIPHIPGSGIIYTLTTRDVDLVTEWLKKCGIQAAPYYSGVQEDEDTTSDEFRQQLEDALYNNDLKVLVATSALGMGYDKPDLGFVIHYQAPNSVISYYQQVGRAGRAIDTSYGILFSGKEDDEIHDYFRRSSFPPESRVNQILNVLEESEGLSINELMKALNLRRGQIEQVLKYLSVENPSPLIKDGSKWKRTAVPFRMDTEKVKRLTTQRLAEWEEMQKYFKYADCSMQFLQNALDDPKKNKCGKCANCVNRRLLPETTQHNNIVEASVFIKHSEFNIKPRIQIPKDALPEFDWAGNIPIDERPEYGKVLSRWNDAGWGKIVAKGKHENHFPDELVDAAYEMIVVRWQPSPTPKWITCVPSNRRPGLVPDFARRLANKLGVPFIPIVTKVKEIPPQKEQENSFHQCNNLDGAFKINGNVKNEPVLLIDDAIDSGWTFTIISALLKKAGSGPVFPMALTSTSVN